MINLFESDKDIVNRDLCIFVVMEQAKDKYNLEEQRKSLPDAPGVYLFRQKGGEVIYVGKAKSLKKRVGSYFNKNVTGKTSIMVRRIAQIEHIVVDTESDALLLENNLIKKYQPRYNILLKDDKSFPWICIKNEPFPRVFMTRNVIRDGSEYYGPYTSVLMVRTLLGLIRKLYPLRTCKYNLTAQNIEKGKFKECLEYHIGNCKAPCTGLQSQKEYDQNIMDVRQILKGNIREIIGTLDKQMKAYAAEYQYEKAQIIKEKLELLQRYSGKSVIVNTALTDIDVFSLVERGNYVAVNYLKVIKGSVVQSHTVEVKKVLDESREEVLSLVIRELRSRFGSRSKTCIVPFPIRDALSGVKLVVPTRGDKKKLLDLGTRNARLYLIEQEKSRENLSQKRKSSGVMETLAKDLRMSRIPLHMECFDNSNLQGSNPVAACVVFRNGKPAKKEYRHYNIKTVQGPDDYASMREIIFRRYSRLLQESKELPQLIIIDGGKGQLNAAMESLRKLGLDKKIAVIGIAKKLEEIYFPGDPVPLYLDKKGESLRIIRWIRDEAHRFGITFHRKKRSDKLLDTFLAEVPGIGEKSVQKLLRDFQSVERIRKAKFADIEPVIGKSKAELLIRYLRDHQGKEK